MGRSSNRINKKNKRIRKHSPNRFIQTTVESHLESMKKDIVRAELYEKNEKRVNVSGVLNMHLRFSDDPVPIIVQDIVVDGDTHVDHMWIEVDNDVYSRLRFAKKGSRFYFTGEVFKYTNSSHHTKLGIRNIKLNNNKERRW